MQEYLAQGGLCTAVSVGGGTGLRPPLTVGASWGAADLAAGASLTRRDVTTGRGRKSPPTCPL